MSEPWFANTGTDTDTDTNKVADMEVDMVADMEGMVDMVGPNFFDQKLTWLAHLCFASLL